MPMICDVRWLNASRDIAVFREPNGSNWKKNFAELSELVKLPILRQVSNVRDIFVIKAAGDEGSIAFLMYQVGLLDCQSPCKHQTLSILGEKSSTAYI